MRILIVDDGAVNRMTLGALLKGHGAVAMAENGLVAIKMVTAAYESGMPFDVIFMDVLMPELDGLEALMAIDQYERDKGITKEERSKIVMITALDDSLHELPAYRQRGDGSLPKPFVKSNLEELLQRLGVA